ncbi:MAG: hypothetical protein F6K48_15110 [Okeania sp. SIO3H1]|nr:hypothetical protein [Okeania sp. SIO3H1]
MKKFQSSNTQKTTNPCTEVDIEKYTQPFISAETLSDDCIKHIAEWANSELKKRSESLSSEDLQEKTPELSDLEKPLYEHISEKPLDDEVLIKRIAEWANSELKKRSESLSSEDLQEKTPELSDLEKPRYEHIPEKPLDDKELKYLKYLSEREQIKHKERITGRLLTLLQISLIGSFFLIALSVAVPGEKSFIKDMASLMINSQTPLVSAALVYYFGKKK